MANRRRLIRQESDEELAEIARLVWPHPPTETEVSAIIHDVIGLELAYEGEETAGNFIRRAAMVAKAYGEPAPKEPGA